METWNFWMGIDFWEVSAWMKERNFMENSILGKKGPKNFKIRLKGLRELQRFKNFCCWSYKKTIYLRFFVGNPFLWVICNILMTNYSCEKFKIEWRAFSTSVVFIFCFPVATKALILAIFQAKSVPTGSFLRLLLSKPPFSQD